MKLTLHIARIFNLHLCLKSDSERDSIEFWSGYQDRMHKDQARNDFRPPAGNERGVEEIVYSHSIVALTDDEVPIRIAPPPRACIDGTTRRTRRTALSTSSSNADRQA